MESSGKFLTTCFHLFLASQVCAVELLYVCCLSVCPSPLSACLSVQLASLEWATTPKD